MSPHYYISLNERVDELDPPHIADEAMKIDNAIQRAAPGRAYRWNVMSQHAGQVTKHQLIVKVDGVKFSSVRDHLDAASAEVVAMIADWHRSGRLDAAKKKPQGRVNETGSPLPL